MIRYKISGVFALLVLLTGCNMNENNAGKKMTHKTDRTDSPTVKAEPVQPQDAPGKGQYCNIARTYQKGRAIWIDADYVQFFMGDAATAAARKKGQAMMDIDEKGDTAWSVPDGYYILNENKKIRSLKLADDVELIVVQGLAPAPPAKLSLEYLQSVVEKDNLFILSFNGDGEVTRIKQQYVP